MRLLHVIGTKKKREESKYMSFIDETKELPARHNYEPVQKNETRQIAANLVQGRNQYDLKRIQAQSKAIEIVRTLISHSVLFRMETEIYCITFTITGSVHAQTAYAILPMNQFPYHHFTKDFGKITLDWSE